MLTFASFTGINNVVPAQRLGETDLVEATDIDIGLTGEVKRRAGFTLVDATCHKNIHQCHGFMLATNGGELVAIHPNATRRVIHSALGFERVWYCNLPDGRTTYTNGLIHGVTDGFTGSERSVPTPASLGYPDQTLGDLFPGDYRYHLTHVRLADRLESPALTSQPISIAQGGLRLDGLPSRDGHVVSVYLSQKDGEGAYLAGVSTGSTFEYSRKNSDLALPCRTIGAREFPVGTITAFWRGRMLVAQGKVLWASRPSAPHLSDWTEFKQMQDPITAIQPVDDGIYVGTTGDLLWLGGATWADLSYTATKRGPVTLGSGVPAPGRQVKLGDATGNGPAMLCIAGGEVVGGFAGGQTYSLSGGKYRTLALEVSATFREVNGIPQYLAVPQ